MNRRILNHLLHDAFSGDDGAAVDPIVDLVLDPDPAPELISEVLAPYPFRDRATAYQNLMALAREDFPFLSQARCRHFLAAIAPRLLEAVGRTPDPDMTLTNLEKVSASLGAKAVLWELFNFNPPSLRLYVELCATSQFLSEILINNPGMIDDLVDSLVVDRPSPGAAIKAELAELCQGAEDLAPILWSFRNKEWVRIGSRDILGREPVREVTRELADVAEAVVDPGGPRPVATAASRFGTPRCCDRPPRDRWAILGAGQVRRPRAELPQRPGPGLPPRGRRDDRGRSGVDLQRAVRDRGRAAGAQGAGGGWPRARCTRLTPGSGRTAPPGRWSDPRRVPRVFSAIDAGLGADGIHAGSGDLRHGRVWPEGDRGGPPDAGQPGGSGATGRKALAMRKKLEASRPRHHLKRGPGGSPTSSSSSNTCSSCMPRASPSCSSPTSGMRWRPCGGTGS